MKPKRIAILIAALLIAAACLFLLLGNPVVSYHNGQLRSALTGLEEGTCTLDEVVPFQWDTVYTFPPYTTREEMEETIGVSSPAIQEAVSEGMVQLIFVSGDQVTASVCGYPENLGYEITFDGQVNFGQGQVFTVSHQDGIVSLTPAAE